MNDIERFGLAAERDAIVQGVLKFAEENVFDVVIEDAILELIFDKDKKDKKKKRVFLLKN